MGGGAAYSRILLSHSEATMIWVEYLVPMDSMGVYSKYSYLTVAFKAFNPGTRIQ